MESVGSLRDEKKNQDTPIQDLSSTGPAIWPRNVEDREGRRTKGNVSHLEKDNEDQMVTQNGKQDSG